MARVKKQTQTQPKNQAQRKAPAKKQPVKKAPAKKQSVKKAPVKAKKAPAKKAQPKTTQPKAPKIARPRAITSESLTEWLTQFEDNVNFRLDRAEKYYNQKKTTPHCVILDLRMVLRELEVIKRRLPPKLVKKRRQTSENASRKPGELLHPYVLSDEMCKFLKVKSGTAMSRAAIISAIAAYIHFDPKKKIPCGTEKEKARKAAKLRWVKKLNPGGKLRNLQNPEDKKHNQIQPDKALAKLLNFNQFKKDVAAGKIETSVGGKQTILKEPILTYALMQKLVQAHFLRKVELEEDEPVEENEPVVEEEDEPEIMEEEEVEDEEDEDVVLEDDELLSGDDYSILDSE